MVGTGNGNSRIEAVSVPQIGTYVATNAPGERIEIDDLGIALTNNSPISVMQAELRQGLLDEANEDFRFESAGQVQPERIPVLSAASTRRVIHLSSAAGTTVDLSANRTDTTIDAQDNTTFVFGEHTTGTHITLNAERDNPSTQPGQQGAIFAMPVAQARRLQVLQNNNANGGHSYVHLSQNGNQGNSIALASHSTYHDSNDPDEPPIRDPGPRITGTLRITGTQGRHIDVPLMQGGRAVHETVDELQRAITAAIQRVEQMPPPVPGQGTGVSR